MSMLGTVPKLIYDKMYEILDTDPLLQYVQTRQKGFYPRASDLISPTLYPWVFIEFGGISNVEIHRMPRVWKYELVISIVAMTIADRGDPTSLVFNDGTNLKKGIGDMVADLGQVYWARKTDQFGIDGINDWSIVRVGTPTVLSVQRLLVNEFVRGVQMDFAFQIVERDVIP